MTGDKKKLLKNIVYRFARLSKVTDMETINSFVDELYNHDIDEATDIVLVSLDNLLNRKLISVDDILSNVNLLLSLNPDKYHSVDDLVARLKWIKSMNLEHPEMSLSKNHKLVTEVFDKFNNLINMDFDCYYTGGLLAYLATKHPLERYHGDLDLFINEEQLFKLYELLKDNYEFSLVSNMDNKECHGHEYKVIYKDTPMSIGLFLFSRLPNNEIILKEYYYLDNDLYVDCHHISPEYAHMLFSDKIQKHNEIFYKMQTLESIYNSKKNSRPKDRYDAQIIKDIIDKEIDYKLDTEKQNNYDVNHLLANNSIVYRLEETMKNITGKSK